MKAIRKSDGKEIDVRLYHSEEYIETEADSGSLGVRVYTAEALILEEPFDWSTFRREAAKDFISGMLANVSPAADQWTTPEIVTAALDIADELIKQLKEEKK